MMLEALRGSQCLAEEESSSGQGYRQQPIPVIHGDGDDYSVRRVRITRETIRKLGFIVGCPGCRAVNRDMPAVNHNEECRKRIEEHLRNQGDPRMVQSDERFNRREEDRANKKRRVADDNQSDVVRGGEVIDTQMEQEGDNRNQSDDHNQQQQGEGENRSENMAFLDIGSTEHVDNHIIDLMDIDLGNPSEIEKAVRTLNSSSVRTTMVSSGAGISKYNREIMSDAVSGKRLLTLDKAHIERAVEIIKEQDNRGLNFAFEIVGGQ